MGVISFGVSGSLWAILGPMMITFLILQVSGIPMLEAKMQTHPDFPEYQRKTHMFFPWF
jgi:steroid 5-alpha reductase family enzyme